MIKYESVEQRNDVLDVMRQYKYKYRTYGNSRESIDALDHSISLEPVQDFFSYNENNESIERDVMEHSDNLFINGLLETLSMRERVVLEMYFGINRDDTLSLGEIGDEFDLTRERIRTIKEKGLQRLRARRDKSTREVKDQYVFMNGEWITK
jgi:RNA polymerase sigma factor (sigma-70 family)